MTARRLLRFLSALWTLVALSAQPREAAALRDSLARDVRALAVRAGCLPGCVVVAGADAAPLAFGFADGVKTPVAAAAVFGKGRAVAVTHTGFFEGDAGERRENVVFLRGCLAWLAGGRPPTVVHLDARQKGMKPAVSAALRDVTGLRVETFRDYAALAELPPGSVAVTMPDAHPFADAEKLRAFVRRGGGVFAPVVGWGWHQLSRGRLFCTESPFNAALGPAGLYTASPTVRGGSDGLYPVASANGLPGSTAADALKLAEGRRSLPAELGARCAFTLGALAEALPPGDEAWRPRLAALARAAAGIVPSPTHPLVGTNVRERLAWSVFQNAWLAEPERNWKAHAAAVVYPGVPAKGTRRETREVAVRLDVPRWHGTGLFAVAGEPLTVELPAGSERLGLHVRVGTTTCRLTAHGEWRRAPVVDMELPLAKAKTTFASPFGGMIYVVVPRQAEGTVTVKVGPACPAAWFVEGRDTPATWRAQLRGHSAPVAELENDHVVITVPFAAVRELADPRPLLQVWREIMDNDARLAGIPSVRASPERICADVQLCAGYMHAGYPIMMPTSCLRNLLDARVIRAGEVDDVWGFFHEMGHNHQNPDWTFDGTGEVTVNFFTLYNMLKICGRTTRRTKMGAPNLRRRVEKWRAAGRPLDQWKRDPFLALDFFARLADKYGWEAFERLFAEYRALSASERPKTDLEKREQWCSRLSRIVGEDLTDEFRFLGVRSVSPAPREL